MTKLFLPHYNIARLKTGYNFSLPHSKFREFGPAMLDLGDISQEGVPSDVLAAMFDLEGFTSFCNQVDPHLVIPDFLNRFLDWLFESVSKQSFQKKRSKDVALWCQLPFYAKFLGDGVLFLWDTAAFESFLFGNLVTGLRLVCADYQREFLSEIKHRVSKPPIRLRCGIARGRIISIGDGTDFVGPCINLAAKLQKIEQFSFAFSKRGFDLESHFVASERELYTLIRSPVAGHGEDGELLFVLKEELLQLPAKERKRLRS